MEDKFGLFNNPIKISSNKHDENEHNDKKTKDPVTSTIFEKIFGKSSVFDDAIIPIKQFLFNTYVQITSTFELDNKGNILYKEDFIDNFPNAIRNDNFINIIKSRYILGCPMEDTPDDYNYMQHFFFINIELIGLIAFINLNDFQDKRPSSNETLASTVKSALELLSKNDGFGFPNLRWIEDINGFDNKKMSTINDYECLLNTIIDKRGLNNRLLNRDDILYMFSAVLGKYNQTLFINNGDIDSLKNALSNELINVYQLSDELANDISCDQLSNDIVEFIKYESVRFLEPISYKQ